MATQYPAISHPFDLPTDSILANDLLREPQREAYAALAEHWKSSTTPAIVQVPVGCGKTGLMATLPFGICRQRALLVAPNVTIRSAIARSVDPTQPTCFWRKMGIPATADRGPFCACWTAPMRVTKTAREVISWWPTFSRSSAFATGG
jgi:hypothetical protein